MLKPIIHLTTRVMTFWLVLISIGLVYGSIQGIPYIIQIVDDLTCQKFCSDASLKDHPASDAVRDEVNTLIELTNEGEGLINRESYSIQYWRARNNGTNFRFEGISGSGAIRLGDIVAHFGKPCSVTITEDATYLQYLHFFGGIRIKIDPSKEETLNIFLSPSMPVDILQIEGQMYPCDNPVLFDVALNIVSNWHGFTMLRVYVAHKIR